MANKIKLAGTTANAFQIGLQGVTLNAAPATSAYQLNLPANVGSSNQYLKTDGTGNLSWATVSGGSGTPGGANTQIQFNDDSAFGGSAAFTFNKTSNVIAATGNISANYFIGNGALLTGIATGTQSLIANGTSNVSIPIASGNILVTSNANTSLTVTPTDVIVGIGTTGNITGANGVYANLVNAASSVQTPLVNATSITSNSVTSNFFIGNVIRGTSSVNMPAANGNIVLTVAGVNSANITSTGVNVAGTLNVVGAATFNGNANVKITGGSSGQLLSTDGLGNLSWINTPNGTAIVNGNSNVRVIANGNVVTSVTGNTNVFIVTSNAAIVGTGAGGNITGANVVTANLFTGNLTTNAQPNITSLGTLTSLSVSGNVSMSSNTVMQFGVYTIAGKPTTASVGQVIALSDSTPGGMLAYWDTTNSRWSYIHDNSAV